MVVYGPNLGPKYFNIHGIWTLNPYYLDPWTLRALLGPRSYRGYIGMMPNGNYYNGVL